MEHYILNYLKSVTRKWRTKNYVCWSYWNKYSKNQIFGFTQGSVWFNLLSSDLFSEIHDASVSYYAYDSKAYYSVHLWCDEEEHKLVSFNS